MSILVCDMEPVWVQMFGEYGAKAGIAGDGLADTSLNMV